MKNNLNEPCNECPFRKNSARGWLGGITVQETYSAVMHHEENFACHLTRHKKEQQMSRCRGSLLFMKKGGKLPRYNRQLAEAIDKVGKVSMDNILSVVEFFKHHSR
jgi:hypothetical protein